MLWVEILFEIKGESQISVCEVHIFIPMAHQEQSRTAQSNFLPENGPLTRINPERPEMS